MKTHIIFVITFILLSSFSCEKSNSPTPQVVDGVIVRTGTSFGFCMGDCEKELEIKTGLMTYIVKNRQIKTTGNESAIARTCTDKISTTEITTLSQFTTDGDTQYEAFKQMPATVGCPDCADGGAEWIEIEKNNSKYRVTFEYGKDVKEISELLKFLRAKRINFEKTCL